MKTFLSLSLIIFLIISVSAQRPQTLLGDGIEYTSGFGGFMLTFPTIDGDVWSMTGGGGAVIINNQFYLGGYGYGLADDKREIDGGGTEYSIDFSYGGIMMGYIIMPERIVHIDVMTKVGWGEISLRPIPAQPTIDIVGDNVFLVVPSVAAEVNMTSWFKLNAGFGYQFANGVDNIFYQDGDFNGITYNLSLLFGWFR